MDLWFRVSVQVSVDDCLRVCVYFRNGTLDGLIRFGFSMYKHRRSSTTGAFFFFSTLHASQMTGLVMTRLFVFDPGLLFEKRRLGS